MSPAGIRQATLVVVYPRIVHCEMLTHRVFSRNSSSSRAIPVDRLIRLIEKDPYIPEEWGQNQKGMQSGESLDGITAIRCRQEWMSAMKAAIFHARNLSALQVHKLWVNRLLEPFSWITVIITATDWANFFALRCHRAAHPDMRRIATMMRDALQASAPRHVDHGCWHIPFLTEEEMPWQDRTDRNVRLRHLLISAGRCARVSYLTHDGKHDPEADFDLGSRMMIERPMSASPFEHQATPLASGKSMGNLRGWRQLRHDLPNESVLDDDEEVCHEG